MKAVRSTLTTDNCANILIGNVHGCNVKETVFLICLYLEYECYLCTVISEYSDGLCDLNSQTVPHTCCPCYKGVEDV